MLGGAVGILLVRPSGATTTLQPLVAVLGALIIAKVVTIVLVQRDIDHAYRTRYARTERGWIAVLVLGVGVVLPFVSLLWSPTLAAPAAICAIVGAWFARWAFVKLPFAGPDRASDAYWASK